MNSHLPTPTSFLAHKSVTDARAIYEELEQARARRMLLSLAYVLLETLPCPWSQAGVGACCLAPIHSAWRLLRKWLSKEPGSRGCK